MEEVTLTVFKTDDGMIFESREEAKKHEALTDEKELLLKLEEKLKDMELDADDPKVKCLIPVEEFLTGGSNGQSLKRVKRENSLRYFLVNTDADVSLLARYIDVRRKIRDKEEDIEGSTDNITPEEIVETFCGEYPCPVFICDRFKGIDHYYNTVIGSFNEQMQRVEEYCKKNGHEVLFR